MKRTPVKGNGTLFGVTDADEYDRRTGGWFSSSFPETYRLQKTMIAGREHPQFSAFKHMALALGKALLEAQISESLVKSHPVDGTHRLSKADRLRKAVESRRAKWRDDESSIL